MRLDRLFVITPSLLVDTYNDERPHTSLNGLTPAEFANRSKQDHNQNSLYL